MTATALASPINSCSLPREPRPINPFLRAILEGRTTYEHHVDHVLCRFYEHENGRWCVMISTPAGQTISNYETKRECWDEGIREAGEAAERTAHLYGPGPIRRFIKRRQPTARPCPSMGGGY